VTVNLGGGPDDLETVTLTETGLDTGVFQGSIPSSSAGGGANEDGTLQAAANDDLQADYVDADDPTDTSSDTAVVQTPSATRFTDATFVVDLDAYPEDATIYVETTDLDENQDSGVAETVDVTVTVNPGGGPDDLETVTLTETGVDTGVFQGSIGSSSAGGGANEDGTLQAVASDGLQADYTDADDPTDTSSDTALVLSASTTRFTDATFVVDMDAYPENSTIYVETTDVDENQDSGVAETVDVTVTVNLGGGPDDVETVTLTETGVDTGVFQGSIPSSSVGPGADEDGTLQAAANDDLQVDYVDADDPTDTSSDTAVVQTPSTTRFTESDFFTNALIYSEDGTIYVEIVDADEDQDSGVVETIEATLTVNPGGGPDDVETLTLMESDMNSGRFRVSIPSSSAGGGADEDGTVQAVSGDALQVDYVDADDPTDTSSDTAAIAAPPAKTAIGFSDSTTLAWSGGAESTTYSVYRGDLGTLFASGAYTQLPGSVPGAEQFCSLSVNELEDLYEPSPGAAVFYLVTAGLGGSEGSLGEDSDGTIRPNQNSCW